MKKGFTLIELLVVIIILVIIALITMPIILNIIDEAQRKALKISANSYINTIQQTVMMDDLYQSVETLDHVTCSLTKQTMVCNNEKRIELNMEGDKLDALNIEFENDNVIASATFRKGKYCGSYIKNKPIDVFLCGHENIDAFQVSFIPEDTDWKVTNVGEALESLFDY